MARARAGLIGSSIAALGSLAACAQDDPGDPPYDRLSDYGFFQGELAAMQPADGVIPYTVAAPLWADDARKGRFIVLPPGEKIGFAEQDDWVFPEGTTLIKSFFFDTDRSQTGDQSRIIETRLLVLEEGTWTSYIYQWDDAQSEATRVRGGADVVVDYVDAGGQPAQQDYIVPDEATCENCHARDDVPVLLGPFTHQMNTTYEIDGETVNQIDWLREQDLFDSAVPEAAQLPAFPLPESDAELDARARGYLHGNCAHCHRPGGGGGASGLSFLAWEQDPLAYGICKVPAAAGPGAGGRSRDIVPGSPDDSIVVYRMQSSDPEIKMPELPSLLADDFGAALISEWIAAMPPDDCSGG